MNNFTFHIPTNIRFGKDQIQCLPEELAKYGKKVLLVYLVAGALKGVAFMTRSGSFLRILKCQNCPG